MCKICLSCNGIMNYDPYFEANVCSKCGKMERIKNKKNQENILKQKIEITKQIFYQ